MITYFECGWRLNVNGKNIQFNPSLIMVQETFPHSYTSPHIHSWIFKTLRVIISWVWVIRKMKIWIVKRKSLNNLSVTCHGLENFTPLLPMLSYPFVNFPTLWVITFWVWVSHKWLNANWDKIDSIILSVTCHSLRNFLPIIHIPSFLFMNFWNPMSCYFLSLSHL